MRIETEFPNDDQALFDRLRKKPNIAWPTLCLLFACLSAIAYVWYACLTGTLSLAWGCVINSLAMYYLFSPIHDAMHKAIFRHSRANDIALFLAVLPALPLTTGQFLKMMHMQHHRFANDALDPDHELAKNTKNALFLWFFWGFNYQNFYRIHQAELPSFDLMLKRYDALVLLVVILPLLFFMPGEMLMLWFIPVLVMNWLICYVFMYLPHHPHKVKHKDDPYQATRIRKGYEYLLSPLMANQNYHLVHHLYPTVPFYRYRRLWLAKEQFHLSFNPAIVKPFSLHKDA